MARFIRVVGGRPRLAVGALMASVVATLWYGVTLGVISLVDILGSGAASALEDLNRFISGDIIGRIFGLGAEALRTAFVELAAFNSSTFGALALAAAAIEVAGLTYLFLWVVSGLVRRAFS